ncbi:Ger(x)C family spore germination protein [Paenibacillus lignilyticus]|uniref:Ger(X)C family spore germination protein n=1 Tax=Paenibacillus lignilyticus TaxID=1172615 RepID=A0ABS5C8V0_9BACL|nr:Ger(x)C family spore germination protein [Paenibacillus lignilyticus]MBP3961543.1 Ger(x)C family spore germination protein [Paenibacillus lignilyticus]MBP3963787.1 Ger(x)C family spore germination protein [Paenibacillus lignilyticus]
MTGIRFIKVLFTLTMFVMLLPGCFDQMNLEDASISLMLGIDVDEDNQIVIYSQSPVFYREAKEKTESAFVRADSIRLARAKFDSMLTGITTGGKLQSILVGKRLLQQKDWYDIFDLFYRVPKQTETPIIVVVDGPIENIFHYKPIDKPRLSLHVRKLIETANKGNITVSRNLQELRREMKDKGMTASLTQLKKEKQNVVVTGTALLNKQGQLKEHFSLQETTLFLLLQHQFTGTPSFILELDGVQEESEDGNHAVKNAVAFEILKSRYDVGTNVRDGRFIFDVTMQLNIIVTTMQTDDPEYAKETTPKLQRLIATKLQQQFQQLIHRCQDKQIDPFGFGIYARAYQYKAWKPVQDDWGAAFADANVNIKLKVAIKSTGVVDLYSPL